MGWILVFAAAEPFAWALRPSRSVVLHSLQTVLAPGPTLFLVLLAAFVLVEAGTSRTDHSYPL